MSHRGACGEQWYARCVILPDGTCGAAAFGIVVRVTPEAHRGERLAGGEEDERRVGRTGSARWASAHPVTEEALRLGKRGGIHACYGGVDDYGDLLAEWRRVPKGAQYRRRSRDTGPRHHPVQNMCQR
jgi:hypothetical protein